MGGGREDQENFFMFLKNRLLCLLLLTYIEFGTPLVMIFNFNFIFVNMI